VRALRLIGFGAVVLAVLRPAEERAFWIFLALFCLALAFELHLRARHRGGVARPVSANGDDTTQTASPFASAPDRPGAGSAAFVTGGVLGATAGFVTGGAMEGGGFSSGGGMDDAASSSGGSEGGSSGGE
jgi:hypothetical protein